MDESTLVIGSKEASGVVMTSKTLSISHASGGLCNNFNLKHELVNIYPTFISPIYHEGIQEQVQSKAIHVRRNAQNKENKQIKTQSACVKGTSYLPLDVMK